MSKIVKKAKFKFSLKLQCVLAEFKQGASKVYQSIASASSETNKLWSRVKCNTARITITGEKKATKTLENFCEYFGEYCFGV